MKLHGTRLKKRWMLLILAVLMALHLSGCGKDEEVDKGTLVKQECSFWTL